MKPGLPPERRVGPGNTWCAPPGDVDYKTLTDQEVVARAREGRDAAYRELIGRNFPAMAVVGVTALVEPRAKIEIETLAVVPE